MPVELVKSSNDEWMFATRSFVVHVKGEPERAWIEKHYDIIKENIIRCRTLLEYELTYKVQQCYIKVRICNQQMLTVYYDRCILDDDQIKPQIYMYVSKNSFRQSSEHIDLDTFKSIYENLDTIQARFINERQRQEKIYDNLHADIER